jgi:hypothetical protein
VISIPMKRPSLFTSPPARNASSAVKAVDRGSNLATHEAGI